MHFHISSVSITIKRIAPVTIKKSIETRKTIIALLVTRRARLKRKEREACNVVKMSIGFRIGWIRFPRTTGNHRGCFCIDYSQKYAESKRTLKQTSSGHFS